MHQKKKQSTPNVERSTFWVNSVICIATALQDMINIIFTNKSTVSSTFQISKDPLDSDCITFGWILKPSRNYFTAYAISVLVSHIKYIRAPSACLYGNSVLIEPSSVPLFLIIGVRTVLQILKPKHSKAFFM